MPIQKALLEAQINPNNMSIYIYDLPRQKNQYGCDIFSMHDTLQFAKNSEEIIKWVLNSTPSNCKNRIDNDVVMPCYKFSSLPPSMMQLTHYVDNLKKYDDLEGQNVEAQLRLKNKIGNYKGKDLNLKMELKLRKYVANLLISKDMIE